MPTPPAEIAIDEALIESLLTAQHPDLATRRVSIVANGWDKVMARLGSDLAVRLPRRAAAFLTRIHVPAPPTAPVNRVRGGRLDDRSAMVGTGVDPSLVMQHYGSKAALFVAAVQLPAGQENDVSKHLSEVLGVRLGTLPPETRALVQSMLTVPEATESMREFLDERVENLTRSLDGDDARLRELITVSGILGLTITQHFLRLHAFDGATPDELLAAAHGWAASLTDSRSAAAE